MIETSLNLGKARLPRLGLGTGRLRGDDAVKAIHAALDCGYGHIDTAAKYGNEADVGLALRTHRLDRDAVFITTKVMAPQLAGSEGNTDPEASLRRLQLDFVDLLLLHWPNQELPLAAQLDPLMRAVECGQARHIGVCNFPPAWLREAHRRGYPIVANQAERHPYLEQTELTQTCLELGVALIAFSPMGRGALLEDLVVLDLAERHQRSPAQIVLRWHLEKPGNAVVPSSSNPDRIATNIALFDFELAPEDHAALDRLVRPGSRVVSGPPGYEWTSSTPG